LDIYNSAGQLIETISNLNGKQKAEIQLQIAGIYLVNIEGLDGIKSSLRLIKE
jgi:hypothetical protein